ncbi:hypothetical protein VTH06DRAFT_3312 [Thermothelomyces fergusii]
MHCRNHLLVLSGPLSQVLGCPRAADPAIGSASAARTRFRLGTKNPPFLRQGEGPVDTAPPHKPGTRGPEASRRRARDVEPWERKGWTAPSPGCSVLWRRACVPDLRNERYTDDYETTQGLCVWVQHI